jgi:hypothetical protein
VVTKQSNQATAGLDLDTLVRRLHGSGIRVGIQTYDDGIQVWISDRLHRVRQERVFEPSVAKPIGRDDSVALWLHAAVVQLFPDSAYAHAVGSKN